MSVVSIHDQVDEVEREVRNREHLYPVQIAKGRLKPETADVKLQHLRAAAATMRIIADHADGLRELLKALRAKAGELDMARLAEHPAVVEVLKQFPDAVLSGIGPIPKHASDDQSEIQSDE